MYMWGPYWVYSGKREDFENYHRNTTIAGKWILTDSSMPRLWDSFTKVDEMVESGLIPEAKLSRKGHMDPFPYSDPVICV